MTNWKNKKKENCEFLKKSSVYSVVKVNGLEAIFKQLTALIIQ